LDRLQQARAQEAVVIGAALPAVEGTEGGGWGTGADLGRASQALVSAENGTGVSQINNLAGFAAAWEIDVFGKFRRAIEAAQYDVEAAVAARNVVLISLIADVTRAYLDLRALQMSLAVLRKNIEVAQKYVDFVHERYNRGITNELDVTLAERELAQLQAQVAPLIAQISAARYVIAVLIGEFPENLGKELTKPGMLPALPARIRPGLPIGLLRRRPDIAEAERQLAGATALIGVATADLFPRVAVVASAGNEQALGGVPINPIWSVGPAVAAPLLDFGRLDAIVGKADFRARELSVQLQTNGSQRGARSGYSDWGLCRAAGPCASFGRRADGGEKGRQFGHGTVRSGIDGFAQRDRRTAPGIRNRATIRLSAGKRRRAIRNAL
jgi:NodT family efflux transporter outer membrane factor (OMF) lipoprotein